MANKPPALADCLPQFNEGLGRFYELPDHFKQTYDGVVTQIYPLRANPTRLQTFCDQYLNVAGSAGPFYFYASTPWVLLQVANYGIVATGAENLGWFSQRELAFGFPVEWYTRPIDKPEAPLVFADWAMVYPFIFVDDALSITGGREIFGWPKAAIQVNSVPPVFQPADDRCLISISLVVAGHGVARPDPKPFLDIFQRSPLLSTHSGLLALATAIPRGLFGSLSNLDSLFDAARLQLRGPSELHSLYKVIHRLFGRLLAFAPLLSSPAKNSAYPQPSDDPAANVPAINLVTLKQVRDVPDPKSPRTPLACFQAIVGSKARIERVNDSGLLFDVLAGDITGGISINLLDTPLHPIVDQLGLQTAELSTIDGERALKLQPTLPFWMKMDLTYGHAYHQIWRTCVSAWTTGCPTMMDKVEIPYISFGSGAQDEVPGPYHFPRIRFRALPVKATISALEALIANYLDNSLFSLSVVVERPIPEDPEHMWIPLVISDYQNMKSQADPVNSYSDSEITFLIPVSWTAKTQEAKNREGFGYVPVYSFVGADWTAATNNEIYGRLVFKSIFTNGILNPWVVSLPSMPESPPNLLLSVQTELFPKIEKGQKSALREVLRFVQTWHRKASKSDSNEDEARVRIDVVSYLMDMGMGPFLRSDPFSNVTLKQVRDATDPALDDFQSIVVINSRFFIDPECVGEIEHVKIKITDYGTLQIVGTLGLVYSSYEQKEDCCTYTLDPGPQTLWFAGRMSEDGGVNLCVRVSEKDG